MELRQMELRRTNPAWEQMNESVVDHSAVSERKEERAEAERERAREYRAELDKMKDRVLMGPTLFERQAKVRLVQLDIKQEIEAFHNIHHRRL